MYQYSPYMSKPKDGFLAPTLVVGLIFSQIATVIPMVNDGAPMQFAAAACAVFALASFGIWVLSKLRVTGTSQDEMALAPSRLPTVPVQFVNRP